jgi:hypothetical protein
MRIEDNAVTLPAPGIMADGGLLPREHAHYLRRIPCATPRRWYAAFIQPYCNSPQRRCAGCL